MAVLGMLARSNRRETLNTQELRLALAMRGGVSLCVWIGGAVAEIDRLRRFEPGSPYRRLAELAGYTGVKVDVLAGASAGGLNGVIYGAAQVFGFDFAAMRELWLGLADIADLSRSPFSSIDEGLAGPPRHGRRPPSLLRGDSYFLARLEEQLGALKAVGDPAQGVDHVDVILSATRWAPEPVRSYDNRFAPIDESRSAAYFHFRHRPGRSDFTGAGAVGRLARAARTTSSFPAAFEPARLDFDGASDLTGVFTPPPERGAGSLFAIDGGVLDNIPVAAAVEAIAATPAGGATDRWLLYLHPSPGRPQDPKAGARPNGHDTVGDRPRAVKVVQRFLAARLDQESLLTDIDELDALNAELGAQRLRRDGLLGPLSAAASAATAKGTDPNRAVTRAALAQWQTQRSALVPVRARIDAARLAEVLERPDEVLLGSDAPRFGRPTEGWGPLRSLLAPTLAAVLELDYERDPEATFADVASLVAAADLVLGLTHWLQRFLPAGDGTLAEAKLAAYAVRADAAARLVDASRIWPTAAASLPGTGPDGPDRAHTLTAWALATVAEWRGAVDADELWTRLAQATDSVRSALGPIDAAVAEAGWTGDRVDKAQQARVAEAASELGGYDAALASVQQTEVDAAYRALLGAKPNQSVAVLQALAGLVTPLQASPVAATPPISFLRLAGTNRCPIGDLLPGLFAGMDHDQPLDAGTKLCGDELGNFAAFLSARWRANDWMWGRLDAVVSLVDLLCDAHRLYVFATLETDPADHAGLDTARDRLVRDLAALAESPVNVEPVETIRTEIAALFARPNDLHLLPDTRRLVARRLQWDVLRAELPRVEATGEDPPPAGATVPTHEPLAPGDERLARYAVGTQSVYDLSERRVASIGMRLALVGLRAVKPDGRPGGNATGFARVGAVLARGTALGLLSALKPLYLVLAFTLSAPRRARLVLAIFGGGLAGAIKRRPRDWPGWPWNEGWPVVTMAVWAAVLLFALALTAWCVTALRRELGRHPAGRFGSLGRFNQPPVRRELIAVVTLALGLVGNAAAWPAAAEWRIALVAGGAGLLIWGGAFWMRPTARWVLAVVGVVPFLAGATLIAHRLGGGASWWLVDVLDALARSGWPIALGLAAVAGGLAALRWASEPDDAGTLGRVLSPRVGVTLAIAALWAAALWTTNLDRQLGVSGWALIALAVASVAQTLIITYWDVLPRRPGDRAPGASPPLVRGSPADRQPDSAPLVANTG